MSDVEKKVFVNTKTLETSNYQNFIGSQIYEKIRDRAAKQKKISKFDEDSLLIILEVINYINSLDEDTCVIWDDHRLDDIPCLKEFESFIIPDCVRFDTSLRSTNDLLRRPNAKCLYTFYQYMDALDGFRGNFKKDAKSDTVTFGSLRKKVALMDVLDKCIFTDSDDDVRVKDKAFVPIALDDSAKDLKCMFADRYFNDNSIATIKDFIVTQLTFI